MALQREGKKMKELFQLMRDIYKLSDGQAEVCLNDDENLSTSESDTENSDCSISFFVTIKPNSGYYQGASCKFQVILEQDYPTDPPSVTCCNAIYHPNIDLPEDGIGGSVCVNLLDSDWQPEVGLDGCVMAILFLFYNPQLDDALSPVFSGSLMDLDEFAENVKISMRGGELDGFSFDKIIIDDHTIAVDNCMSNDRDKIESTTCDMPNEGETKTELGIEDIDYIKKSQAKKEAGEEHNEYVIENAKLPDKFSYCLFTEDNNDNEQEMQENSSPVTGNMNLNDVGMEDIVCQNNATCNNIDRSTSFHIDMNLILEPKVSNHFKSLASHFKNKLNIFSRLRKWISYHRNQSSYR